MKLWIIFAIFVLFSCSALAGSVEIPQESLSLYYVESATGEEAETYDVDIQGNVICLLPKDIEYEKKTCLSYDCKTYKLQKEKFAAPGQIRLNKNKEFEGIVSLSDNKFCYEADPKVDRWLKFGENSIVVVSTASTNFWLGGGMYFMPQNVQGNYVSVDYSLVQLPIDHVHNSVGYWNESANGYLETSTDLQLSMHFIDDSDPAVDSSEVGGTTNGTVSGATWTSSGKYGGAYSFNGSHYLNVPVSPTAELTLSGWFKFTNLSANQYLFDTNDSDNKDRFYTTISGDNMVYGWRYNSTGADRKRTVTKSSLGLVSNDAWYHIVIVASSSGNYYKWYTNGELKDDYAVTGLSVGTPDPTIFICASETPGIYCTGTIDEVKIWNRSLSADEVKQEYIIGARNFQYSGNYPPGESYYVEKGAEWLMPVINRDVAFAGYPYLSGSSITLNYENRRPICDIGQNSTALDCDCPPGSNMNTVTFICQEVVGGASSITLVSDESSEPGQDFFSDIGQFINKNVGLVAILMILLLMFASGKKSRR